MSEEGLTLVPGTSQGHVSQCWAQDRAELP